jgi:hypothetical protein
LLTLEELKQRLADRFDPDDLLEMLEIDSPLLVELAESIIQDKYDDLVKEVPDESSNYQEA